MPILDPEQERRPAVACLSRAIDAAKDAMRSLSRAKPGDEITNENFFQDMKQFHDASLAAIAAGRRYIVSLAPAQIQEKYSHQTENPDTEPKQNDGHKYTEGEPEGARSTY